MVKDLFSLGAAERRFSETVSQLSHCNPFTRARLELEKQALGAEYVSSESNWNVYVGSSGALVNVERIVERLTPLLEKMREQLAAGFMPSDAESEYYADLLLFYLYHRYRSELSRVVEQSLRQGGKPGPISFYREFDQQCRYYLQVHRRFEAEEYSSPHLFALAFQISRAFFHIYHFVIGSSFPMIELRARIWESIFSVNLRRYRISLFQRMVDIPTLITGPSGTGKELVARAVGLARYIPFDKGSSRFIEDFHLSFQALNLSAFASSLIESELFGHKKGAFTGAISDREGWLAQSGKLGTVFLDEIGELELPIQVKLLRVLESRSFQRLGDNRTFRFEGKLIAATNRDLGAEIAKERFRADLFFRLCADKIETPSLRARIDADPDELRIMIDFLARRVLRDEEVHEFVDNSQKWILKHLGKSYEWRGNVRELEQCLKNLIVHGSYVPFSSPKKDTSEITALSERMREGTVSLEELSSRYLAHVYKIAGTFEETGRRVGIDRRTVKSKLLVDIE